MAHLLKLGALDLSSYLRLAPGEGFDPYDGSGFVEPQFGSSPLAEGQPLISTDLQNREMAWPVHLKGVAATASNLFVNPSFEVNVTDGVVVASGQYGLTAAHSSPPGREAGATPTNGGAYRMVCTMSTSLGGGMAFALSGSFTAGDVLSFSWYEGGSGATKAWEYYLHDGTNISAVTAYTLPATFPTQRTATITVPATTSSLRFVLRSATNDTHFPRFDAFCAVTGSTPQTTYFDGDTSGYGWTGTSHNSTSGPMVATKDGAHTLIQQINNEIANNKQLRVEWRDEGATASTFYDVAFARFDPEFNFRRAAKNYESGSIRVWCAPPYGHTGTYRGAGSALSPSSVAFTVPIPSIAGDAPALADIRVSCGTGFVPEHGRIGIVAGLPHASYTFLVPAGSMVVPAGVGVATIRGASGAIASQALSVVAPAIGAHIVPGFQTYLSPASVYAGGRHRVMALARQGIHDKSVVVTTRGPDSRNLDGAVPGVPSSMLGLWHVVDQGVLSVPTNPPSATLVLTTFLETNDQSTYMHHGDPNGIASSAAEINALVIVPEENFQLVVDSSKRLVALDHHNMNDNKFGNVSSLSNDFLSTYDQLGNDIYSGTYWSLGTPPGQNWSGAFRSASGLLGGIAQSGGGAHGIEITPITDMETLYNFGPATAADPDGILLWNGIQEAGIPSSARWFRGRADLGVALGAPHIGLQYCRGNAGNASTLASRAIAAATANAAEFRCGPGQMSFAVRYMGSLVASIGIGSRPLRFPGHPIIGAYRSGIDTIFKGMRSTEVPSQAVAAADVIRFSPDGVQVYSAASAFYRDVSGKARGREVTLTPSTVAVGVVAVGYDGGKANDILSAEVRVLERFQFAR